MLKITHRPPPGSAPEALTPDERRFALGTRSLADLVAPAAVEVARDHVRLDYQYARTLVVTGYTKVIVRRQEYVSYAEVDDDRDEHWQHSGGRYEIWATPNPS